MINDNAYLQTRPCKRPNEELMNEACFAHCIQNNYSTYGSDTPTVGTILIAKFQPRY